VPDVYFYQCDITDTPAVERLCQQIKRKYGTVSVLINNAGIGIGKTILEVSEVF
jgi:all-trans-retinol dehydrogenase (NAD+)